MVNNEKMGAAHSIPRKNDVGTFTSTEMITTSMDFFERQILPWKDVGRFHFHGSG